MNLKLSNERRSWAPAEPLIARASIKEERRRTGRYIAILVGISLLFLALYQAWVRRIPVVASLIVPALIMFVYIAWVLYTASRDKRNRARDLERALNESGSPTPSPERGTPMTATATAMEEPGAHRVDVDLQLNNAAEAPAAACVSLTGRGTRERSASPRPRCAISAANSFTNVSFQVRYCHGSNVLPDEVSGHLDATDAQAHFAIKPIILVNDEPRVDSEEHLAAQSEADCACACTALIHKHERTQRERSPVAVFRRSYSIA